MSEEPVLDKKLLDKLYKTIDINEELESTEEFEDIISKFGYELEQDQDLNQEICEYVDNFDLTSVDMALDPLDNYVGYVTDSNVIAESTNVYENISGIMSLVADMQGMIRDISIDVQITRNELISLRNEIRQTRPTSPTTSHPFVYPNAPTIY